ncbi:MAG: imidazole glycerol phosphate synthase subunit HisF [Armatimonadota bacterium]|nr:MAG: imidazole glycerol phosphate synthase subunit HisF [Armatimonadota bacterium]
MPDYRRIIPCLDMKDGRVVKGVHFVDLRDAGDPVEAGRAYSEAGADEIAFLDISATVEGRGTMLDVLRKTVGAVTVPLVVGGGIRSVDDVQQLLDIGVSAVSLNTAAVRNPDLVRDIAGKFTSERLIVAIDVRRNQEMPSGYEVVTRGGTQPEGIDAIDWGKRCRDAGAGQILPTSMDTDGTKAGSDNLLNRMLAEATGLPVIASGGAGTLEHFYDAIVEGKADAVLAASVFHFGEIGIREAKEYLAGRGVPVRL